MRVPRATYRLQFNREFTFRDAIALVPYLHELGVSHLYASPFLRARPGSMHGYDVVDHQSLNPEIGTLEELELLFAALRAHDMGLVLDLVPNHMGVQGSDNPWWLDVLENGQASPCAGFFDIDWQAGKEALRGKVLLPVLGDHYGAMLNDGKLRLAFDADRGEFSVHYENHRFPLDPATYRVILGHLLEQNGAGSEWSAVLEVLQRELSALPPHDAASEEARRERPARVAEIKRRLVALHRSDASFAPRVEAALQDFNGTPGAPASFDRLHELLEAQAYRLAYWRVAADEINYRRFFDINDLAALKMESPPVFEATHRHISDLIRRGPVDGLRIDHPDGLCDPEAYFRDLRASYGEGVYLIIEKILAAFENMPERWPVHGTTGYRFLNLVNGLLVDPSGQASLDRTYRAFGGRMPPFRDIVHTCKRLVMETSLAGELALLSRRLARIAERRRTTRDYTLAALQDALLETIACFPVYRTYLNREGLDDEGRRYIEWAVARARKLSLAADPGVYDFVRDALTCDLVRADADADYADEVRAFAQRFQQVTGPAMAKGFEDTACYRYARLLALNEVGGDPSIAGISLAAFHAASADRNRRFPHTLLATSTHDTKRSEDARVRLGVISEFPAEWRRALFRWSRLNRHRKGLAGDEPAPSTGDEYYFYQSLLALWPLREVDAPGLRQLGARLSQHMQKAVREAKVHSSWMNPDAEYEAGLAQFVGGCLAEGNAFLADFIPLAQRWARYGLLNSLAQTLIKLASPGVPDFYQGSELWLTSLTDPDNRGAVDFDARRELLDTLPRRGDPLCTPQTMADGQAKLLLVQRALQLRRHRPALFAQGAYRPLSAEGERSDHVCAFARTHESGSVVVVAPRFWSGLVRDPQRPLEQCWGDTCLPLQSLPGTRAWVNVLTGEHVRLQGASDTPRIMMRALLTQFPVALLADPAAAAQPT
jgi:(1->4)-alpha-D-glucan 1-alpha-D-glucosylmutase